MQIVDFINVKHNWNIFLLKLLMVSAIKLTQHRMSLGNIPGVGKKVI